jgi:Flp pilus assembly protein TadG
MNVARQNYPCFWRDRRGVAAIEFALTLPLLLSLFLGQFEIVSAVRANLKLQSAAQTLANLITEQAVITPSQVTDFCAGAQLVLAPLPTTNLQAAIASVSQTAQGTAVDWQDGSCGGAGSMSNAVALASSAVSGVGDSAIVVQASYVYNSPVGFILPTPITMTQIALARPRSNATIIHN